jgi:hypothetical protein
MEKKTDSTKDVAIQDIGSSKLPTKWATIKQIETYIGDMDDMKEKGRAKLTVIHYCGEDKKALIGQLKTLLDGLENGFDGFAG